jgi:hypothetical protein
VKRNCRTRLRVRKGKASRDLAILGGCGGMKSARH